MMLESLGIPKELLVLSLWGDLEEVGSILVKEYLSNRIEKFASESKGKQAKCEIFLFPCPFMWDPTRECAPGFSLQII